MKAQLFQFFKQLPLAVYLVAGGIAVFGSWLALDRAHQRAIGKQELQIVQYEMANRDLRMEADSLRKAYKPQAVAAAKWHTKWDTLRAGVDTQWLKPDSVPVPVEVVRTIVVTADSAIRTCTQALQTCEARVGIAQRGWDGARQELKVLKASFPSPVQKYRWLVGGVIGGAVIGYVAKP